jgi:hypothetical protein
MQLNSDSRWRIPTRIMIEYYDSEPIYYSQINSRHAVTYDNNNAFHYKCVSNVNASTWVNIGCWIVCRKEQLWTTIYWIHGSRHFSIKKLLNHLFRTDVTNVNNWSETAAMRRDQETNTCVALHAIFTFFSHTRLQISILSLHSPGSSILMLSPCPTIVLRRQHALSFWPEFSTQCSFGRTMETFLAVVSYL